MTARKLVGLLGIAVLAGSVLVTSVSDADARRRDRNRKNKQDAIAWCQKFKDRTRLRCKVEKCPCGIGDKKIKKIKRRRSRGACVCLSRRTMRHYNRQRAQRTCAAYTRKYGVKCTVSRRNCPPGKIAVKKFRGGPRVKYSACRDKKGAERLKRGANKLTLIRPKAQLLIGGYRAMFTRIRRKADRLTRLPVRTRRTLQRRYPRVNLAQVRIARSSRAPKNGCITDCTRIYCSSRGFVNGVRRGRLSRLLLHEIAHTEQCRVWGGRNRYALKWFRNLPVGIVRGFKRGSDSYIDRVHDKMPMEAKAERKARRVCGSLRRCP